MCLDLFVMILEAGYLDLVHINNGFSLIVVKHREIQNIINLYQAHCLQIIGGKYKASRPQQTLFSHSMWTMSEMFTLEIVGCPTD